MSDISGAKEEALLPVKHEVWNRFRESARQVHRFILNEQQNQEYSPYIKSRLLQAKIASSQLNGIIELILRDI